MTEASYGPVKEVCDVRSGQLREFINVLRTEVVEQVGTCKPFYFSVV